MNNGIHFISGLPRSGSTLLSGILRQNPKIHAHISTPVAQIYGAVQVALSGKSEYHPLVGDHQRRAILRGLFENYYTGLHKSKIIVDTNRSWTGKMSGLLELFPNAKFICCVRPLAQIVNSFERLVRESPFEPSSIFNYNCGGNVYTRAEHLNSNNGVLGLAYQSLKDAFFGPYAGALILVPYGALTQAPEHTMREIYQFLEWEPFEHDFDNVEIEAEEFDRKLGARGLHTVGRSVRPGSRELSLPPDLIQRWQYSQFWGDPERNPNGVRIVSLPAPAAPVGVRMAELL